MRRLLAFVLPALVACATAAENSDSSSAEVKEAIPTLHADAKTACPAGYVTTPPHEGANLDFVAGGQSRTFELLLPPPSFKGPRPLFLAFHGTGETGESFIQRARLREWAARGFIVVAPDSVGNGSIWPVWDGMRLPGTEQDPNPDLALADALLACHAAHFKIEKARVFTGGHSAGGIFTNYILKSRSEVFAGGIVSSGVFDFTIPANVRPLDPMTVIVTWGGDNDGFGTDPTIDGFTFVEQASIASKYFERQANVGQAYCRGNDIGHSWLPINNWLIDLFLSRPKGTPKETLELAPLPQNARSVCKLGGFQDPPLPQLVCPASNTPGCQASCQFMADCAVENRTVMTSLVSELSQLGLSATSCGGCITRCEEIATTEADKTALECLAQQQAASTCGPGIEGAFPAFGAINTCCPGSGSNVCRELCDKLIYSAAGAFLTGCQ